MSLDQSPDSPLFGIGYAIAAYVVIFAALFGYLAFLHLAQRRALGRLLRIERQLAERVEAERVARSQPPRA